MVAVVALPYKVDEFFDTRTSSGWVEEARSRLPELLNDHANCELKAASTALGLIYRYPNRPQLVQQMSRLAREELLKVSLGHFDVLRVGQTPAGGQAMNVGVHRKGGMPEGLGHDDAGGLVPNAG